VLLGGWRRGLSHFTRGDLTKSSDNLSIIRVNKRLCSAKELLGSLCGKHDQLESVGNFDKAIFDSNSRHGQNLLEMYNPLREIWAP
jgi:hypothetical protein